MANVIIDRMHLGKGADRLSLDELVVLALGRAPRASDLVIELIDATPQPEKGDAHGKAAPAPRTAKQHGKRRAPRP